MGFVKEGGGGNKNCKFRTELAVVLEVKKNKNEFKKCIPRGI